jgi:hypothetical protein
MSARVRTCIHITKAVPASGNSYVELVADEPGCMGFNGVHRIIICPFCVGFVHATFHELQTVGPLPADTRHAPK